MGMFARRRKLAAAISEQPVSRWLIIAMLCVIVSFGLLIQGDVEMPGFVIILGGLIGGGTLLLVGWRHPEVPLYVMVVYLPFSKVLVGDFGGGVTALNLTNMLIGLLILTWLTSEGGGKGVRLEPHILHLLILRLSDHVLDRQPYLLQLLGNSRLDLRLQLVEVEEHICVQLLEKE